jgi:hypothetical protein
LYIVKTLWNPLSGSSLMILVSVFLDIAFPSRKKKEKKKQSQHQFAENLGFLMNSQKIDQIDQKN